MADNFGALTAELQARGYDYLDDGVRAQRYLNRGYTMLCEEYPWGFLEKEVTDTAPITIDDLRQVIFAADIDNGYELTGEDQRGILTLDPGSDSTGTPTSWYLDGDEFTVYPPGDAENIRVRYIQVPPELSDEADEPLVPQRYRNLIVDAAVYLALKDNDEYDSAMALKALYDAEVGQMISRLSIRDLQNPPSIVHIP